MTHRWERETYHLGVVPQIIITLKAILLCRLQCSTAMAMTKPPKNIILASYLRTKWTMNEQGHFGHEYLKGVSQSGI